MSSGALRLSQYALVQNIQSKFRGLFSKYLLITNTTVTVCMSGVGDMLEQRFEKLTSRHTPTKWDRTRTKHMSLTGLAIGPVCHYWYLFLDRILPGRTLRVVAKKIMIDQVVFSPINISLFLVVVNWMEGSSAKTIVHDLKDKGMDLYKAEWIIWPPAQLVNFCFVPSRYRVLYDNSVSLAFDCYYSHVMYGKRKTIADTSIDFVEAEEDVESPDYALNFDEYMEES